MQPTSSILHEDRPAAADCATAGGGAPAGRFRSLSKRRDEAAVEMCECLIDIAAAYFSVSSKELRSAGRTSMVVSRVRQVAMYVAHVALRLTQAEIGRGFGRDRTTVAHACQVVEDMRDDMEFDRLVATLELIAQAAFRGRLDL